MTDGYEFKLPDLGEGLTEGEIARWLVSEGQEIAEDDPLVEIQTDKTTVEIPSPAAGKVAQILVEEGKVVPVGTVLVVIGGDGADGGTARRLHACRRPHREGRGDAARAQDRAGARRRPRHRSRARVRKGRITEEDVRAAAGPGEGRREPLRGVRRLIAEHMTRAHREVPAVTWVEECDFSDVDLKQLVPTVLKACAEALKEFPELNARLEGDEIVYLDRYDLGVAVQTEQGLVVPVVRDCASRSIDELQRGRRAPRRERARRNAEAGGAARLDVHRHERGQARRPVPDADRQPSRGRDPQHRPHRRAPGRARRRRRARADRLRLASRSTIVSSTGRARPSSASPSSAGSSRAEAARSQRRRGASGTGAVAPGVA